MGSIKLEISVSKSVGNSITGIRRTTEYWFDRKSENHPMSSWPSRRTYLRLLYVCICIDWRSTIRIRICRWYICILYVEVE